MNKLNLSEFAVTHKTLVLFFVSVIMLAGIHAFMNLGRLEDPVFNIPSITIGVAWPGASAQEVQDDVLNKLEQSLAELDLYDYVTSYSRQGYGVITLWLKDNGSSKKVLEDSWYKARKKINDVLPQLPSGVQGPFINDEYADVYSALFVLTSDKYGPADLLEYAKKIKLDFRTIPDVKKIDIYGQQDQKVYVDVSSKKIASLGIPLQRIKETLHRYNELRPMGVVDSDADQVFLRMKHTLQTPESINKLSLEHDGKLIKFSDFSQVSAGYKYPKTYAVRFNGKPGLVIAVSSKENVNIINLGKELNKKFKWWQNKLLPDVKLEKNFDQPQVVEESIWEFERSFLEALIIVLAVSFLSLGWRTGIVISMSVPLVLAIVSLVMFLCGWTLNRVTLGALIISLGLLVDDAIISTESMLVKVEAGWDKIKAATFAYTSTAFPMLTGTLVTIAGFMPVGFARSGAGEYASGIFWIVCVALIASWFVAVIFTPVVGMSLLKKLPGEEGGHHEEKDNQYMSRLVEKFIIHRKTILISTVVLLFASIMGMMLVQQQFFPATPRKELMIDIRMKEGSSFQSTEREVNKIERFLKKQTGIDYFTAYIGGGSPRFFLSLAPELPNPGYAQFVIVSKTLEDRNNLRQALTNLFETDPAFANERARVTFLDFGPPIGFPVQFRVIGREPDTLRNIAYNVLEQVRKSPLVIDTQLNWNEKVRSYKVNIDEDKALKSGLDNSSIADTLNTVLYGSTATVLRRGDELIDVIVRGDKKERNLDEGINNIYLFTKNGKSVPLNQVATLEPTVEEPVLWRRNREYLISVRADLAKGIQGPDATSKIWPTLQGIINTLPEGYRIEIAGAKEESDKANDALNKVFPAMLIAIVLLLMIQLQSLSMLVMVLLSAPLGLIGVVPALLILQQPFGFVALLGLIALAGMIMRNTLILVDQIDHNIQSGLTPWDAIIQATVSRARPVFLTALSAILGMIPLSTSLFWGPMAISIMGGLFAATGLTLIFVPALYAFWYKVEKV